MDLPNEFDNRVSLLFTADEMSEPLIMVYQHLSFVAHFGCDYLLLTPPELCFVKNDVSIHKFPVAYGNHSIYDYYRACFLAVFERDDLVQKLFRYEFSNVGDLIIRLVG